MPITVTEYDSLPLDANGNVLHIFEPHLGSTGYTATATSASHTVGGSGNEKRFCRISGNQDIHLKVGAAATTNDPFLISGAEYLVQVNAGQTVNFRTA